MMSRVWAATAMSALFLAAIVPSEAFTPSSLSVLKLSRPLATCSMRRRGQRLALRMQEDNPWQWDEAKQQYYDPASGIRYDPNTGEYIQPPAAPPPPPGAPPKPAATVDKYAGMSQRDIQMAKVLEKQRIQDEEKQRRGALALESNRVAVIIGLLIIFVPTLTLLISFGAGILPNPFEVCIEGGTNC